MHFIDQFSTLIARYKCYNQKDWKHSHQSLLTNRIGVAMQILYVTLHSIASQNTVGNPKTKLRIIHQANFLVSRKCWNTMASLLCQPKMQKPIAPRIVRGLLSRTCSCLSIGNKETYQSRNTYSKIALNFLKHFILTIMQAIKRYMALLLFKQLSDSQKTCAHYT